MQTNDRPLTDLMKAAAEGKAQLPDFQRGWVWDDDRIKALILSIIHNYPVERPCFCPMETKVSTLSINR